MSLLLLFQLFLMFFAVHGKERIALHFVSRDRAVVLHNGLNIFETLHPRNDSCWFVGRVKNEADKDTLLSLPDGCEEENDGWIMLNGQPHYLNFTSKNRRYAMLEPFSEHILSNRRQKRSTKITDYVIPENYAQMQTEEKPVGREAILSLLASPFRNRRHKRQTAEQFMEIGVFVDQAVYDFFAARYTLSAAEVRTKVLNYINGVMDSVHILYQLTSLSPKISFKIAKLEIWTTQPNSVPVPQNMDAAQYLTDFCAYASPQTNSYDHATLFTGLSLQYSGSSELGGLANLGTICTNTACSLVKTVNTGFNAAYILAHEIGHGLNMGHDGDASVPLASSCSDTCCIMAPSPNESSNRGRLQGKKFLKYGSSKILVGKRFCWAVLL